MTLLPLRGAATPFPFLSVISVLSDETLPLLMPQASFTS
jgi:hypothetical protein